MWCTSPLPIRSGLLCSSTWLENFRRLCKLPILALFSVFDHITYGFSLLSTFWRVSNVVVSLPNRVATTCRAFGHILGVRSLYGEWFHSLYSRYHLLIPVRGERLVLRTQYSAFGHFFVFVSSASPTYLFQQLLLRPHGIYCVVLCTSSFVVFFFPCWRQYTLDRKFHRQHFLTLCRYLTKRLCSIRRQCSTLIGPLPTFSPFMYRWLVFARWWWISHIVRCFVKFLSIFSSSLFTLGFQRYTDLMWFRAHLLPKTCFWRSTSKPPLFLFAADTLFLLSFMPLYLIPSASNIPKYL